MPGPPAFASGPREEPPRKRPLSGVGGDGWLASIMMVRCGNASRGGFGPLAPAIAPPALAGTRTAAHWRPEPEPEDSQPDMYAPHG